jgi:hypothetical protein
LYEEEERLPTDTLHWSPQSEGKKKMRHRYNWKKGRDIAQAVSRWLPTTAARVRARVWQMGFVVDKVALGQVFSEYFGYPCESSFHQILHHHHHHNHPGQVQ